MEQGSGKRRKTAENGGKRPETAENGGNGTDIGGGGHSKVPAAVEVGYKSKLEECVLMGWSPSRVACIGRVCIASKQPNAQ